MESAGLSIRGVDRHPPTPTLLRNPGAEEAPSYLQGTYVDISVGLSLPGRGPERVAGLHKLQTQGHGQSPEPWLWLWVSASGAEVTAGHLTVAQLSGDGVD